MPCRGLFFKASLSPKLTSLFGLDFQGLGLLELDSGLSTKSQIRISRNNLWFLFLNPLQFGGKGYQYILLKGAGQELCFDH